MLEGNKQTLWKRAKAARMENKKRGLQFYIVKTTSDSISRRQESYKNLGKEYSRKRKQLGQRSKCRNLLLFHDAAMI